MRREIAGLGLVLVALAGCGDGQQAEQAAGDQNRPAGQDSFTRELPRDTATGSDAMAGGSAPLPGANATGGTFAPGAGQGTTPASQGNPGVAPAGTSGQLTPVPPGTPLPAPVGTAANDILSRAERTYAGVRSMEADFVQQVYVPLLNSTQNSRGKLFHRAPDRFLMRFSDPQGDVVVADGRYVWMYYPSTDERQVMRSALGDGQSVDLQREFLSNSAQKYVATRTGGETVGGRQSHALTLVPRGASPYRQVKIWVDAEDNLVRRFEIIETNGTIRKLEMSGLRPNVTLADNLFQFTPPPGAQVYEP